jgi:methionyl-tRNA formyltransferase
MKLLFMGSAEFAQPTLQALIDSTKHEVLKVITQPAKPAGRGLQNKATPIYDLAVKNHRDCYTFLPSAKELQRWGVEGIVVVAYGEKIPTEIHNQFLCLNVHPSLLPKYRGASPLQTALLNGDAETGVSIIMVAERMDAGDIVLQKSTPIDENESIEDLHDRLAQMGAQMMLEALDMDITQARRPQDEALVTRCRKIKKEDSKINWSDSPLKIHNQVRAISGFTEHKGKRVKIWETHLVNGTLEIDQVQPEGKTPMPYAEFVKGYGALQKH